MAATPTTRWQIGAHRFSARRLDHALVLGDTSMRHDPMRSTSRAALVGIVIAVLVLAVCAALAFIRPATRIGDAAVVMEKSSGALYVVENDVLHPAYNLASARLFVGAADDPVAVGSDEIAGMSRGPSIGIDGAPQTLPLSDPAMTWSVCEYATGTDRVGATTVIVRPRAAGVQNGTGSVDGRVPFDADDAVLWTRDGVEYLVYAGVRARVDLRDTAVTRALGLEDAVPMAVGRGLFDTVPEVPAISPPAIANSGAPASYWTGGRPVGSVVTVDLGDRSQHYVILEDGIQAVGPATAQLLRFADSAGRVGVDGVAPDLVARAPRTANPLAVGTFPERPPRIVDPEDALCVDWTGADTATGFAGSIVMTRGGLPERGAVGLGTADGPGESLDFFSIAPGSGVYVVGTGMAVDDVRRDSAFYVADTGVRFGVPDASDAQALGIGDPVPVPWPIVGLLPSGPALTALAARTVHDGS